MEVKSPGGFVFGIQGWEYGEIRPKAVTFFLDGTARVSDHRGNPIQELTGTHAEVVEKLGEDGVDWKTLDWAGWPQLPYDELKELPRVPETPLDELLKIKDKTLRADAVRLRRETDAAAAAERSEELQTA